MAAPAPLGRDGRCPSRPSGAGAAIWSNRKARLGMTPTPSSASRGGRLKLRRTPDGRGELIFYERPDAAGPRLSCFRITPTDDPDGLEAVLARALGVLGAVRKRRLLYLVGQTRVHLDSVEGLGDFLELEVVLAEGQSAEDGERVARGLMERLGVREDDLVAGAYLDLLLAEGQAGS
ncbi:adenylate cyclase CyaB-like [Rhynochetos jubatus]